MAALGQAVQAWMDEEFGDLRAQIRQAFNEVRSLSVSAPGQIANAPRGSQDSGAGGGG
ncbi:MAG: hypothetical protein QOF74_5296 [Caballeronia mineralivorans]|jgi:hypothetical protein|nr:hypothetical protein [Caballeronia mineralivorans]